MSVKINSTKGKLGFGENPYAKIYIYSPTNVGLNVIKPTSKLEVLPSQGLGLKDFTPSDKLDISSVVK